MIALTVLRPFAKPILALLLCLIVFLMFKHYIHVQQKIGQLEQQLVEKQQQLQSQDQTLEKIRTQVLEQSRSIAELQKAQTEIHSNYEQRKVTLNEIFTHDQDSKNWAIQPVPDAIRGMFNSNAKSPGAKTLSNAQPMH
ncbi:hypothetical protein L291_1737 [Acinetobacter guillouiae MSP4-18]|uniref:hypothetical protein n=1 Tax=Acinetobacter guillouiae TaxID=106649 RepID=UPI0002D02E64|nr:hypothetical protein [Acinetobacter guillouiae]ENU57140.1 hypothetical protein F981_03814 [Acinetobacter guillouiae CIP 63.46]EPH36193.1 hypothetical protein L291_1737 [Acinetobacter guillouiae MSP4-18]KAB0624224.1 hypothetical protein F7P82_18100 [Acinetobacter guillouiae]